MQRLALFRLFLAAAITLPVFPNAWGYTLLPLMIVPEFHYGAGIALIASLVATFFLTRNLGQALVDVRWTHWVVVGVATGWLATLGISAWLMILPSMWLPAFTMLFLLSTIWLPCTACLPTADRFPLRSGCCLASSFC